MLKFLSICSGIEAASVAFAPLGWEALAFSEIEPFPCAVLAHHYPHVPNLGDLTRWCDWPESLLVQVELLCGGTPCQAFSVAGLRQSLADDRGNLSLIFCELYAHINQLRRAAGLPPALLLWENVPGVLSTHDNAFGCFLAGLAGESLPLQPAGGKWTHAGHVSGPSASVAWRTLDAQYFGLAQRRKRVFVVGSADPAFDPAAVLFEWDGLRRDTPPRRQSGETTAPTLSARAKGGGGLGTDADCDGACIPEITQSQAHTAPTQPQTIVADVCPTLLGGGNTTGGHRPPGSTVDNCESLIPTLANCLTRRMHKGPNTTLDEGPNTTLDEGQTLLVDVTHSLRAEGFDASEDGTGRGTPLVPVRAGSADLLSAPVPESPIPFDTTQITSATNRSQPKGGDPCHPLAAGAHAPAIAFSGRMRGDDGRGYDRPPMVFGDLAGTQCARAEDLSPVLQSHNPTAVAFQPRLARNGRGYTGDLVNALQAQSGQSGKGDAAPHVAVQEAVGFEPRYYLRDNKTGGAPSDIATLKADACKAGDGSPTVAYTLHGTREGTGSAIQNSSNTIVSQFLETTANAPIPLWRVRRLTPEECELLQGFPLGYTLLPGKNTRPRKADDLADTIAYLLALGMDERTASSCAHSPDGPRYKALGNSWAVPCARWIARRIQQHLNFLQFSTV